MKVIKTAKYAKLAQTSPSTSVMIPEDADTGSQNEGWGKERHRKFLKEFDVGPQQDPIQRLDNMSMAVNAISEQVDANKHWEVEEIPEYFTNIVSQLSGDVNKTPKSIADLFGLATRAGGSVKILYSETSGLSDLGKTLWSINKWTNLIPNFMRENKGNKAGPFCMLLQKLGVTQDVEELFRQEWQSLLQKATNWGILVNYSPSEWAIDTSVLGRDVTITPTS